MRNERRMQNAERRVATDLIQEGNNHPPLAVVNLSVKLTPATFFSENRHPFVTS